MTERERLIELINDVKDTYPTITIINGMRQDSSEVIADHLLSNGVIVPPCKVGDVVWFDTYKKSGTVSLGIQPHKVDRIDVICVVGEKELVETKLHDWYFGDSVFLTKEEAEKALKERGEGK